MRPKLLLITCSFLASGCASIALPDADLCIADPSRQRLICQHLSTDYDVVGNRLQLKPGAKPHVRALARPMDVDKWTCTDPPGWAAIKAWGQAMTDRYVGCVCN